MNKIIDFLNGPALGIILIVSVLLIVPAKDRPDYLMAAIIGIVMGLIWMVSKSFKT